MVHLKKGKGVSNIALFPSPGIWVVLTVKLLMRVRRVTLRTRSNIWGDLECFELMMAMTE